jgi:hypothetical protein
MVTGAFRILFGVLLSVAPLGGAHAQAYRPDYADQYNSSSNSSTTPPSSSASSRSG